MKKADDRNRMTQNTDTTILNRVDEALWKDEVLRMDYKKIVVSVENQIVHLSGYVVSASNQQRLMRAIEHIPGILGIKNNLFLDDSLEREVAVALGQIERTGQVRFFTGVRHGVVTLNGEVSDIPSHAQAEKCAAGIPGIRGVLNHIRIQGITQKPEDLRFLQPAIKSHIYFSDGPSGTVSQVIINPNNLLVIAMIVQGPFSRFPEPSGYMRVKRTLASRKIVIPVQEIRYLTKRSGFLNIRTFDSTRYADYESKAYISPGKNWNPPLPYRVENVLFPANDKETTFPGDDKVFHESVATPVEASILPEQALPVTSADIAGIQ
jgi:osmotically-inducible protein OsmY